MVGMSEAHHFQRGSPSAKNGGVRFVIGIKLVDDIDRLRGHSQSGHEGVVGNDGIIFQPSPGDEIVELNSQQNFAFVAQLAGEFLRHRVQILPLI